MKKKLVLSFIFVFMMIFLASCNLLGGSPTDPGTTLNPTSDKQTPSVSSLTDGNNSSSLDNSSTSNGQVAPSTSSGQVNPSTSNSSSNGVNNSSSSSSRTNQVTPSTSNVIPSSSSSNVTSPSSSQSSTNEFPWVRPSSSSTPSSSDSVTTAVQPSSSTSTVTVTDPVFTSSTTDIPHVITYEVIFYDFDGNAIPVEVVEGETVEPPYIQPEFIINHVYYKFNGWHKSPLLDDDIYLFNQPVLESFNLYPEYIQSPEQIICQFYNGDNSYHVCTTNYGERIEVPESPTKTGYRFVGWSRSNSISEIEKDFIATGTPVFYAQFVKQWTVSFVTEGSSVSPMIVDDNSLITLPTTAKDNYTFDGWYTSNSYNENEKFTESTPVTSNIILYAKFTEISNDDISEDTIYSFSGASQVSGDYIFTGSAVEGADPFTENKLTVNTKNNGKFVSNNGGWYQINKNTVLSFSTSQAVTIKFTLYSETSFTIVGEGLNKTVSQTEASFVTTGAGDVSITMNGNTYIKILEITMRDLSKTPKKLKPMDLTISAGETTKAGNGTYKSTEAKRIYLKNEEMDLSGIYAIITYTDNSTEIVDINSGLEITSFSSATLGNGKLVMSYTSAGVTVSEYLSIHVVDMDPVIINNTIQVKVDSVTQLEQGTKLGEYIIFSRINYALDYLRALHKNVAYSDYKMLMYLASGSYYEKIDIDLPNLTIVGEDSESTIIEYDSLYGETEKNGFTHVTDSTATVTIRESATNLLLYNLTISNVWNNRQRYIDLGKDSEHRALAMLIYADKVIVQNCRLLGYQDTLEAMTGRSYFYQSYISGSVDFIFGTNCTIYFEECEIHSVDNQSTDGGYINAFKGANKVQSDGTATDYVEYGAIYNKCIFTADSEITSSNTAIARPWSKYSAVMVMNSQIGPHIATTAYSNGATKNQRYVSWGTAQTSPKADDSTIKHYEFNNSGLGAISGTQAGVTVLTDADEAAKYSTFSYIFGTTNGGVKYDDIWSPIRYHETTTPTSNLEINIAKGYTEGLFVEFNSSIPVSAYYKKTTDSTYIEVESELIRMNNGTGRLDVIGLTPGDYLVKLVDSSNNEVVSPELSVVADDRSGYAHFGNSTGIGAYNNDGTLKSDAKVIYVTDENKNTVECDGYVGLVAILQGNHSTPIDIRIVGSIKTTQWNQIIYTESSKTVALYEKQSEKLGGTGKTGKVYASTILDSNNNWNSYSDDIAAGITELNGLTSYASCSIKDSGKTSEHYEWDSYWNMCDISERSNITIEGIGINATIFQWGFTFAKCNSIEVKNLTFDDYTEDAIGIQGGSSTDLNYGNYWIHNCTFEEGVNRWDVSYEQDKGDGDGSTDFKYAHNLTISYCKYNGTHKTNLIGGDNAALQYNITLHHDHYVGCKARLPLVRQTNIHMYNNYYQGTTSTGISARAHAFAFVENCYFDGKNPYMLAYETSKSVDPVGTTIKAIGNQFSSSTSTSDSSSNGLGIMQNGIFVLTGADSNKAYSSDLTATRTTTSSTSVCRPDGVTDYTNFDTNPDLFYYDSVKNKSNVSRMDNAADLADVLTYLAGAGACGGEYRDSNNSSNTGTNTDTMHTVSYSTEYGTAPSPSSRYYLTSADLPTLTYEGYTFAGWYVNTLSGTQAYNGMQLDSDITLVAKWNKNGTSSSTRIIFNPSDLDASEINSGTTLDIFKVVGTEDGKVNLRAGGSFVYNEEFYEVQDSLYLGGTARFNENLFVEFTLSQTATVTIVAKSSNTSEERTINMVFANNTSTVVTTFAAGTSTSVTTRNNISAGKYRVGSAKSGVYIYAIIIEY